MLASASPRRRELLALLGVPFEVVPADIDEARDAPSPSALVELLALEKARAVQALHPSDVVLGSDTVVVLEGRILGKPTDAEDARAMLAALRGRTHEVTTGLAVLSADRAPLVTSVTTEVRMRTYSEAEVGAYVSRGWDADGPLDKAGAYAIQDAVFAPVEATTGCVCSVVGLPLWTVRRLLGEVGVEAGAPSLPRCAGCPEAGRTSG
ncbi:MAG: septum formation protein Maf [Dehalococcoidia bacterium]|nr:septum formation protein Maf [Dehalococcoidia bacterium]